MSNPVLMQNGEREDFSLEPEDDLDTFNDETFGGEIDEWQESAHEELAHLTEQERDALKASNDFFDFGSDDGEALEPVQRRNGGAKGHGQPRNNGSLEPLQARSGGSLEQRNTEQQPQPNAGPRMSGEEMEYRAAPPTQQFTGLSLEPQVQTPLTIQTSMPLNPGVFPAQVLPPYLATQMQYNLVAPLQDPAIMSFSKMSQPPLVHHLPQAYTQIQQLPPPGNFPPPVPPHMMHPTQLYSPPTILAPSPANTFGTTTPSPYPHTVMGFKTMQDVENEMLYGPRVQTEVLPRPYHSARGDTSYPPPPRQQQQGYQQQQQGYQHHQQQQGYQQQHHAQQQQVMNQQHLINQQQQQQLLNRNLNYPGMRDRQQHQVFNKVNNRDAQQRYQEPQRNQSWNNRDTHENIRNNRNDGGDNDHRYNQRAGDGHHHKHHPHQRQHEEWEDDEAEEDSWRWNEVRNRNRDSATRKDLMPGHVHVLGILRHSRSRHEHQEHRDPEDDCLGDDAPLINPTGDPLLDAKLSEEQAELASRCRYFNETEDEYSGLMSSRDKQFIINIQLSQLKCENPYVDDYYYTMFTAKKQHTEDLESTGQMLLCESMEHENQYIPTQFQNSLGKLQVVTVKAPRQIIDVGVVRSQEVSSPEDERADPGLTVVKDTRRSGDYKSTLMQLERVYSILLDLESLKLKLAAIPTGAPLREQVTLDLTRQIQNLVTGLSKPGLISQYLQVGKGRGLLSRSLKHLPGAAAARVCQEMLANLGLVCKDKAWMENTWIHLYRHLAQSSLSSLESAMVALSRGAPANLTSVLTSPLGVSTVLAVLFRAVTAAKRGQEKISVPVWRELILQLICWTTSRGSEEACLAAPLVTPQPLDIGFLLTLPQEKLQAWDSFLSSVGVEVKEKT